MEYLIIVPYLMIIAGMGLSYLGILPPMFGWVSSVLGVLFGLGLAVIAMVVGQSNLWLFAVAAFPSLVAIPMMIKDLSYPRINDVTTDVENPPDFVAALQAAANRGRDLSFPNKNGPIIRTGYSNVRPLILNEPLDRAFQCVETVARKQVGWVITCSDAEVGTVEGEATTSVFRFVDDFIIRVSHHDGKSRIDMRSKSRDGLVDASANAKWILLFFEQLEDLTETNG